MMLVVVSCVCAGQQSGNGIASSGTPAQVKKPEELRLRPPSFTFVRIKYSGGRPGSMSWATDYPDADVNFSARFQKVTGFKTEAKGTVQQLTEPNLQQYPFIYIAEGGHMDLSPGEVVGLRRYLLGGGFLMVDDFWGEPEWENVRLEMKRVFPERALVDLSIEHPVFHCFYDIREKPQVPNIMLGIQSQTTGITWEREDAKVPHYRGLYDDKGRLMAIFCHNTDLGDGWERESENAYYFKEFSLKRAYPMGINIVVYALTE
jgi:hypothetical protein